MTLQRYRRNVRLFCSVASTLLLAALLGCSNAPQESPTRLVTISPERPEDPPLPDPSPIRLLEVKFIVLNKDNLPANDDWTYVALTFKDYENLAKNNAEILRWMRETKARLLYHRKKE